MPKHQSFQAHPTPDSGATIDQTHLNRTIRTKGYSLESNREYEIVSFPYHIMLYGPTISISISGRTRSQKRTSDIPSHPNPKLPRKQKPIQKPKNEKQRSHDYTSPLILPLLLSLATSSPILRCLLLLPLSLRFAYIHPRAPACAAGSPHDTSAAATDDDTVVCVPWGDGTGTWHGRGD